jgi:aspartokinase
MRMTRTLLFLSWLAMFLAGCCSADCCPLQKDCYGVKTCEPPPYSAAEVE